MLALLRSSRLARYVRTDNKCRFFSLPRVITSYKPLSISSRGFLATMRDSIGALSPDSNGCSAPVAPGIDLTGRPSPYIVPETDGLPSGTFDCDIGCKLSAGHASLG